jgi:hypothetical protein
LTCHIIRHIFHPFLKRDTGSTRCKQTLKVYWRRSKTFSHYRNRAGTDRSGPVPSLQTSSLSNGNGKELRRDEVWQCEHLRLITHEKIWLRGDVPRRNGNETYNVNRPLHVSKKKKVPPPRFEPWCFMLLLTVPRSFLA